MFVFAYCIQTTTVSSLKALIEIIYSGGAVVCMGTGCKVKFEECVFERCTLIELAGAHATLTGP